MTRRDTVLRLVAGGLGSVCGRLSPALAADGRLRARDLGITPGVHPPGPLNAITDVPGVLVGHVTLVEGDRVRTGVTAIRPHGGNLFQEKVAGAVYVANAFGKLAGFTQVEELGTIETPVVLTNTLSVGVAVQAVVDYTLHLGGNEQVRSVNALVGETNDGGLNDIRGQHVRAEHVRQAIETAKEGAVEEGSVGAGTGTVCFGWKGGIGTASRKLASKDGGYTLGILVQSNYGGQLTIAGAPIAGPPGRAGTRSSSKDNADGSCMIVLATDAPANAHSLRRIAARAAFGLARTGSAYSNGSGDFVIAFSTSPDMRFRHGDASPVARRFLPSDALSPLFQAALETTEEAVYNSLLQATSVKSRFGSAEAIPLERVKEALEKSRGKK